MSQNKNIVLVMGKPNSGKSSALRNLDQTSMVYLNTDLKETPFRDKFMASVEIADAYDVIPYIREIEANEKAQGGILDTITFLMSMFERQYVVTAADTQKAWGNYGNFYRELVHEIKSGTKDYAILAHEETILNKSEMVMESKVPVKGAVGKIGVEADFTTIVAAKQMPVKQLEKYENELLTITDNEREDGVKYVFCTRVTAETAGEKMRSAMGLWKREELFIDNDLKLVFDRLKQYYG